MRHRLENLDLSKIPKGPGIYLFKDANEKVLYIGKSLNLRERIRDHLRSDFLFKRRYWSRVGNPKILEFYLTLTSLEAAQLEFQLIKRFHPSLNVKDNEEEEPKIIALNLEEEFPTLTMVTKRSDRGRALYFGPYVFLKRPYYLYHWLTKRYPLRRCKGYTTKGKTSGCFYLQIKRCLGPCQKGREVRDTYLALIEELVSLFYGKVKIFSTALRKYLRAKTMNLEFEEAANLSQLLRALKYHAERPSVILPTAESFEYLQVEERGRKTSAVMLSYHLGLLQNIKFFSSLDSIPLGYISDLPNNYYYRKIKRLANLNLQYYIRLTEGL